MAPRMNVVTKIVKIWYHYQFEENLAENVLTELNERERTE